MTKYKMPLVVKEINLPIYSEMDGITVNAYKEKCGVDLLELFDVERENNESKDLNIVPKGFFKINVLDITGIMNLKGKKNGVYPSRVISIEVSPFDTAILGIGFGKTDSDYLQIYLSADTSIFPEDFNGDNISINVSASMF